MLTQGRLENQENCTLFETTTDVKSDDFLYNIWLIDGAYRAEHSLY